MAKGIYASQDYCRCGPEKMKPSRVANCRWSPDGQTYYRRRKCLRCGGQFSTVEARLTKGGFSAMVTIMVDVMGRRGVKPAVAFFKSLIGRLRRAKW